MRILARPIKQTSVGTVFEYENMDGTTKIGTLHISYGRFEEPTELIFTGRPGDPEKAPKGNRDHWEKV